MRHLLLASSVVFLAACSAPQIEAQAQYGLSKFDGDFAISSGGASGKTSMKDLGLDGEEGAPGARADFKWGLPHLTVELGKTSSSGSGTTTANLSQGGTTITAGTAVDSDLDLGYLDGILTFDILPTDTVELGLGFGLQTLDIDAKVQQSGTANKVETSESFPIPVLALRAAVDLGPVSFDGLISGMSLTYSGDDLTLYDLDLRARWKLFEYAHVLLGWHRTKIDFRYEDGSSDVVLDMTAEGPYLGVVFAF